MWCRYTDLLLTSERDQYRECLTPEEAEMIELENQRLMEEKNETWSEFKKVTDINSKLIGQSNAKQRIKLHYRMKEENTNLKQEKATLTTKVTKLELENKKLKHQLNIVMPTSLSSTVQLSSSIPLSKEFASKENSVPTPQNARKKVPLNVTTAFSNTMPTPF